MKKFKRVFSIALSAAMVLALTACGGSKAPADEFAIGGMGPLSGDAAIYGTAVQRGIELAVEEINAAGGVNGYKMCFNFQDDECDAEKSVNAYNVVKDWGADLIIGAVTSGCSIAVSGETYADNMFQLTPSGSAVECAQYDNAFRVCFSDPNQGAASAQYIGENKLASKVAVIYDSSSVYSSGIYDSFKKAAADYDFEIVAAEAFTEGSATDFTVQLQKAKDAGADMVFLPIYYKESALILAQADNMGYKPSYFSCDGMDGILTVENFDVKLAEGVMLLTPFAADAKDDLTVKFVSAYQSKYNEVPNQFAADAYDAVYAVKAALEQANATPDMAASDLCNLLKAAMVEISIDGLTGTGMTWDAAGEPNKAPKAVKIVKGVYTAM